MFILQVDDYVNSYDDNGYYYSQIGNLQITPDSEELYNFAPNEVWHEITEDEYKKISNNDNFVLNYDDIHCIGKCTEYQRYIGRKFIGKNILSVIRLNLCIQIYILKMKIHFMRVALLIRNIQKYQKI